MITFRGRTTPLVTPRNQHVGTEATTAIMTGFSPASPEDAPKTKAFLGHQISRLPSDFQNVWRDVFFLLSSWDKGKKLEI